MPRGIAKVPQVMQMEALECGAACLAMILAYYGRWEPLEKVRVSCGVSRGGSKAKNILRAARSYGLSAKGVRGNAEALRRDGSFPCIAHWNHGHFVVVDGFRGRYAYINDPSGGELRITMEEFELRYTGIALMFERSDAFKPGGSKPDTVAYARKRLRGMGKPISFVMLTATIVSLTGILNMPRPYGSVRAARCTCMAAASRAAGLRMVPCK